jgi:hypothetical protein
LSIERKTKKPIEVMITKKQMTMVDRSQGSVSDVLPSLPNELDSLLDEITSKPKSIIDNIPPDADPKSVADNLLLVINKQANPIISTSITSETENEYALSVRSTIKQALSWFDSRLDPDIKSKYAEHRKVTSNKKSLISPFLELDSKLDAQQKVWLKVDRERRAREAAERAADLISMAEIQALEDAQALLSSDDEADVVRGLKLVDTVSQGRADSLLGPLPAYDPSKDRNRPKNTRTVKRVKIIDVSKFRSSFITMFLSESEDGREALRKYLETKVSSVGFENTEKIAGLGSIIHEDKDIIPVRKG